MGLFNLSSVKNRPRRSGFDLSSKVAFSAKVGELLPIKWTLTMPGDKFNLKEQHFTRTQPVNTLPILVCESITIGFGVLFIFFGVMLLK